jgi:hypothetical protein
MTRFRTSVLTAALLLPPAPMLTAAPPAPHRPAPVARPQATPRPVAKPAQPPAAPPAARPQTARPAAQAVRPQSAQPIVKPAASMAQPCPPMVTPSARQPRVATAAPVGQQACPPMVTPSARQSARASAPPSARQQSPGSGFGGGGNSFGQTPIMAGTGSGSVNSGPLGQTAAGDTAVSPNWAPPDAPLTQVASQTLQPPVPSGRGQTFMSAAPVAPNENFYRNDPDVFGMLPNGERLAASGKTFRQTVDAQIRERSDRTADNIRGGPLGAVGYLTGKDKGSDLGASGDGLVQAMGVTVNNARSSPPSSDESEASTSSQSSGDGTSAATRTAVEAAMAKVQAAEQAHGQETDPEALPARQADLDKARSDLEAARVQHREAVINEQTGVAPDNGTPKASGHQEGEKSIEAVNRDNDGTILYVNRKTGEIIKPGKTAGKEDDIPSGFVRAWVPSEVPGRNPGVKDVAINQQESSAKPATRLSNADRARLQQQAMDFLKNNPKKP